METLELENTIGEIKNSVTGLSSIMERTVEGVNELEDRTIEISLNNREKTLKK